MPAPYFPGAYFPVTNNQNNVTVVDKDYMDERDKEIRQIELALGQYLVPDTAHPLVNYLKVDANSNLLLVPSVGNVGIGTPPASDVKLKIADGYAGNRDVLVVDNPDLSPESVDVTTAIRLDNGLNRMARLYTRRSNNEFVIQNIQTGYYAGITFKSGTIGNTTVVRIASGGNVGIGPIVDPTRILTIQQNSATDPIADAWTTYSSRRWKTNIQSIEGALDKVQHLRGVSFDWKANGKHDIGLIAEEVGEVVPEVVVYEKNALDAQSIDYASLVALLIEAIKELARL